jgi:hypothetical protein
MCACILEDIKIRATTSVPICSVLTLLFPFSSTIVSPISRRYNRTHLRPIFHIKVSWNQSIVVFFYRERLPKENPFCWEPGYVQKTHVLLSHFPFTLLLTSLFPFLVQSLVLFIFNVAGSLFSFVIVNVIDWMSINAVFIFFFSCLSVLFL